MTDTNSGKGNDKCNAADQTDSGNDFNLKKGEGYTNGQGIYAGGNGQHKKFF